jgi:hypothetical protein
MMNGKCLMWKRGATIACMVALVGSLGVNAWATPLNEECDAILKGMGSYLKEKTQYSFSIDIIEEKVKDKSNKMEVSRTATLMIKRPNKLKVVAQNDDQSKELWYNGSTLSLLDHKANMYANVDAPKTIDDMLDFALEELQFTMPLVDFTFNNVYEILTAEITGSANLGEEQVKEFTCHHLFFNQETIDWHIWVQTGENAVPRKVVIVYKDVPLKPQFTAEFRTWNFNEEFADADFEFEPPADAEEVEFLVDKREVTQKGGDSDEN